MAKKTCMYCGEAVQEASPPCTIAINGRKNPPATSSSRLWPVPVLPGISPNSGFRLTANRTERSVQARFGRDVYRHIRFQQQDRGCRILQRCREWSIPECGTI